MNKWQKTTWERLPKGVKIILALMLGFVLIFPPRLSTETHIEVCDEEIYDMTIISPDVNIRRDTVTYSNRILASLKEDVKIPKLVKNLSKSTRKSFREEIRVLKGYNIQLEEIKKRLFEEYPKGYKFNTHKKNLNKILAMCILDDILNNTPFEITASQFIWEGTARGEWSELARKANNPFGMKWYEGTSEKYSGVKGYYLQYDDCYNKDGRKIKCKFIHFESLVDAFKAHSQLLKRKHYTKQMKKASTYDWYTPMRDSKVLYLWTHGIANGGYARDKKKYKKSLRSLLAQSGLQKNTIRKTLNLTIDQEIYKHY